MNLILSRKVNDGHWYQVVIEHKLQVRYSFFFFEYLNITWILLQTVTISVGECNLEDSHCEPCNIGNTTCRITANTGLL